LQVASFQRTPFMGIKLINSTNEVIVQLCATEEGIARLTGRWIKVRLSDGAIESRIRFNQPTIGSSSAVQIKALYVRDAISFFAIV